MKKVTVAEATQAINESKSITFLTGAGVSTPSGIPDYRSLKGIYQEIEQPEYLLSHEAMVHEPQKFYSFVKKIYHPNAQPNVIHTEIARLEKYKKSGRCPKILMGYMKKPAVNNLSIFMELFIIVIVENVEKKSLGKAICIVIRTKTAVVKSAQPLFYMAKDFKKKYWNRLHLRLAKLSW